MGFMVDRFVTLRKEKGYKQVSMAEALGLSRSTVAMWEVGRSEPTLDLVAKVAGLLDCSVGYLTGTETERNAQRRLDEIRAEGRDHAEAKIDEMTEPDPVERARQELFDDPDRRALLRLARYGSAQDVRQAAALLDALKKTNPDYYDGDDPA